VESTVQMTDDEDVFFVLLLLHPRLRAAKLFARRLLHKPPRNCPMSRFLECKCFYAQIEHVAYSDHRIQLTLPSDSGRKAEWIAKRLPTAH
jgi:hypothetical protein